ncbi:MAG: hypothetical protein ACR2QF_17950 [Geminicoccaceae bacterium]
MIAAVIGRMRWAKDGNHDEAGSERLADPNIRSLASAWVGVVQK